MRINKIAAIIPILIFFCLSFTLFPVKTSKVFLPIIKMDTSDYISGIININVSEDTWIGNNALPGGCQSNPCSNGEISCEKNCTFSHGGCYNVGGTYIWVGKGSGSSTGTCGVYDNEKHAYLWFNMSDWKTANGNYTGMPWYLIKNATIKLWVDTVTNCQNISLRPVLPNDNNNTVNATIHNLVYTDHYYSSGDYYTENLTFFGSEIQRKCPTVNTTSEWNITDYVINQTKYGNDVFVQLSVVGGFVPGGWSVSFSSKEHTNESQRPYLLIELNPITCGDGHCTALNETEANCPQDCSNINYIEVNGTTFTQPAVINITGWSGNSSAYTYLWSNYNGSIQTMPPNEIGTQTNITLSSQLNPGIYSVYCNSTWNSTLASKNFTVVSNINYIEVNGTSFTQPAVINITGWSGNSSAYTYLWSNYNGSIQTMLPNGVGTQTNITNSSNLNPGVYSVYCNSTWNSTLVSKNFTVGSTTTTTISDGGSNNNGGGGGGGGGGGITTTTTKLTTTYTITTFVKTTSTIITSTLPTTTLPAKTQLKISGKTPIWIIVIAILILGIIVSIIYVIKRREKTTVVDIKLDDFGYEYE